MNRPGEYVPDRTEGITRVEDLPKPRIEQRLALDMNRELRAAQRAKTMKTLHGARSDPDSGHCWC